MDVLFVFAFAIACLIFIGVQIDKIVQAKNKEKTLAEQRRQQEEEEKIKAEKWAVAKAAERAVIAASERPAVEITESQTQHETHEERMERAAQEFEDLLENIPSVDIAIADTPAPEAAMPDISFSNITVRSDRKKLGCFVVIDVETTGLSPETDEILEISAIRFADFKPVEKFWSYTSPSRPIPKRATKINHITDDMFAGKPHFSYIAAALQDFIGKSNLVGHNLLFDLKFIAKYGVDLSSQKRKYYDTLPIARRTLKGPAKKWDDDAGCYDIDYDIDYDVDNFKLDTLCEYYNIINFLDHSALADSYVTGLMIHELEKARR